MRRFRVLLGVLLVTLGCAHIRTPQPLTQAPAAPLTGDGPHIVRLENGLTVLVKRDDRFPLADVRLYVRTGSSYEDPKEAGISHLLEHMVFKGTDKRGPGQTARDVESVGGELNAATSFDYTFYYVEVPDKDWRLGLDIVTDMAFHATVDPKELASEKQVVLSELARGEDSPGSRLFQTFQGMLFKGTSYEWPVIGYRDTVSAITAPDIHRYVARHYQPQSMLLSVVGKVDPQAVVDRARAVYGDLRNTAGVTPPQPFPLAEPGQPQIRVIPGKWNKVYFGAAFPLPDLHSATVPGLELLAQVLGGDETSRLYRTFKYERRLVDDIDCSAMTLERGGLLYISATLDRDKAETFWRELAQELAKLDPMTFTDHELARAKLNLEDSLLQAKETLSGLATKLSSFQFLEGNLQAEDNYLFGVRTADRAELAGLYHEFVRPERLAAAFLTPEGAPLQAETLRKAVDQAWPVKNGTRSAKAAQGGQATQTALPGGSTLVLLPDATLPYTAVSLVWPGGDSLVDPAHQGLPSLVARTLTRGTRKLSATRIEDFLSDRAADLSAAAGKNSFAVNAKFPSRFSKDLFGLLGQILGGPSFPAKEFKLAKEDQTARIRRSEDQPLGLLFRHVTPFLFASAPYSYYSLGQPEVFAKFTDKDIKDFWARQSREPFVLAVCGQFDPEAVKAFAARLEKTLRSESGRPDLPAPQWGAAHEKTLKLPGRNQAHLLLAFPVPGRDDEASSATLSVLRAALAGQSGLLFRDMRDKQGLGYTVTSFLWQTPKAGFLALYIGTKPETVDKARDGFHRAVAALAAKPLPAAEIERARNVLTGEYYQEHQSLLSRSSEAASLLAQGYDRERDRRLLEDAQKVTPAEIQAASRKWLDWGKVYELRVEP